ATLVFSFVGYKTQEISISGKTIVNVTLEQETIGLSEVVVTALGITREKKTLGYAVQEVGSDELTRTHDNNIINTISGKIAGAQVTSGGSTIGSSSRIVIRGNASFSGNQPLFVVDGTPIDNTTTNLGGGGGVDWGNAAADLDPNNIESMTVLKGANAAALYGERATNGVIIITTKKGKKGRKLGVDYNSSVVWQIPGYFPKYQNEYGGGWDGSEYIYHKWLADHPGQNLTYNEYAKQYSYNYVDGMGGGVNDNWPINWGPRLDVGLKLDQYSTGPDSPWISRPNNYKDFFFNGFTAENNIAITSGGEKASGRLSYSNRSSTGIIYNTDQGQNTINASFTLTPNDRVTVTSNLNYLVKKSDNIPRNGYGGIGVDFAWTQRDFDMKYCWDQYKKYGNVFIYPNSDNFFYVYEQTHGLDRERGFGNVSISYKITDWLSLMARGGVDFYRQKLKSITHAETAGNRRKGRGGQFNQTDAFRKEENLDLLLNYDKQFGDIRINGVFGANYRDNLYNSMYMRANDLTVPNLFTISNVKGTPSVSMYDSEKRTNSVFGSANASYKDFLFLGVTGRNDWSSTLPENNRSYFYPSVSLGFDITQAFQIESDLLSFAKLRGSWAKVGGDTGPYQLSKTYGASSFNSISLFAPTGTLPPTNLKPQETTSYEFGANVRLLKNKLSFDITYYDQTTVNQILSVATSSTTGYRAMRMNAGEIENSGVEVMLNATILNNANGLSWDLSVNWSTDKNMVNSLYGDLESYVISGGFGGAKSLGIPGQEWGILWGLPFVRDDNGNIVVGSDGLPKTTNVATNFGTVTPKWIGGINNNFRYKNINLSFLIDMKMGGNFFSCTAWHSYPTGTYTVTTENNVRETGLIVPGVKEDGSPNDIRVSAQDYYCGAWVWNNHEYSILDGTYVKLREVVLGYSFNVSRISWLQKLNVSAFGRNLAILYRDKSTARFGIDPEVGLGGGEGGVGFENFQLPTTRNLGLKLSVGF
ncbi:MAG TPA: SusC/RagA family TonB-linked outer membrane protein, partial [Bacteroidetes bacterium]|nr:SusC/RagA family TonB-linked outer membrane protein [Bacteroidota bacterium]